MKIKKDPCSKRIINHSKVASLLSEEIMGSRTEITRTELFDIMTKISLEIEQYFDDVTIKKVQLTKILKMFFNKHMICSELDNIELSKYE